MKFWKKKAKPSDSSVLLEHSTTTEGELREFIYLDEVSVRSLRASRVGALPAELKDMRSAVLAAEVSGTAATAVPAVAKASIQSTLTSSRAGGAEVLRKTIVQSDFKDLRDGELDRLLLGPAHRLAVPKYDPIMLIDSNEWIIRASDFKRAQLVELSVKLGAAGIFKIGAVFESLTTLLSGTNSQLDPATAKILRDLGPMNTMVQELLSGLVPIECTAVEYIVAEINDVDWVVHKSLVQAVPDILNIRPLTVAATTSSALYWQDLRQVLYADLEFDVLARISKPALSNAWSPVKLADVLRDFSPTTAKAVDDLDALIRRLMKDQSSKENLGLPAVAVTPLVERRLVAFAVAAATTAGKELGEPALAQIRTIALTFDTANSISEMHPAYDDVSALLESEHDIKIALPERARLRADANTLSVATHAESEITDSSEEAPRAILEAEIVAIYW